MFDRDILAKDSGSRIKDSKAHNTKTRFGSFSVSNYVVSKGSERLGETQSQVPCQGQRTLSVCVRPKASPGSPIPLDCAKDPELRSQSNNRICCPLSLSNGF